MKKTKNYAMPYPEQDDYFNVEDFQDMMVSVDDLMKKLSDSGAQISSDAEHLYNQTKAQMDNIQKRMNAFTALRDGSTTGDAELKDIRVAYDGKEYGNAGEAVREQASDIHKALFGAGASIWSKAKSESTKYVAETKGICILNERFTAAGVVAKISRGTFAQNESTLNLDRECSAYIVEFEKNPGTVYMPSAETIKIVSTTKIIFEANGNARCWIPVEKGQYLAVDSTATAYTSESNHVPYMLYDQANKTLECRGFGSAGSIEPVAPYSLALEYKLEYDMDDTGLVKQIDANRETAASLKEDLGEIPKKQGYLSGYITDSTIKIDNEIYDVTTIIDELLKNECKKIVIDVDCYVQKSIILNNGIEIVGNGKSVIYFESGDGFNLSKGSDNVSIHDLIIKGYHIQDDVNVKDNWLINISSDLHNVKLHNLDIESGYNGIKINGWINNYQNIIVSYFKGIGVYIGRSDNTFNTFYINGCQKEGLYISSSNNRIDNIKILSCGKNSNSSCYFKGNRNTISNVEIQDVYNKCAIFENFNNNILSINLDGIRTHITDDASIVLAEFVNCSRNIVNVISSKYGSSVNDLSKDDVIRLNSNCSTNSLILSSLKVTLQDDGVKNNITVLKNDIVSYNIDKILTLEETYSAKKPTALNYIECSDISNEYNDVMYAFKNSGNAGYSGIRFKLKEKQKLFCVAVLSSNTAYSEQINSVFVITDQQNNTINVKSIGDIESYQVITLIGADDTSLADWAVLNGAEDSSVITKIKYIGFFDFKNYSSIMSDIIN